MTTILNTLGRHAHWLVRLSLAGTFIYHGLDKVPPDAFVERSGLPLIVGWLVGLGEVGAGFGIVLGPVVHHLLTRFSALIFIVIMIGAIALVHGQNGWSVLNRGMEFEVLILTISIVFLMKGNEV